MILMKKVSEKYSYLYFEEFQGREGYLGYYNGYYVYVVKN